MKEPMKTMFRKAYLSCVLLTACTDVLSAQSTGSPLRDARPTLSLSPAVVTARGSFSQTLAETLTLSNLTPNDFAFEMAANDVIIKDGGRIFVPAGETPHSIAESAVFSAKSGLVKPYTSMSVDVRFTIPAETDVRAVAAIFRGVNAVSQNASSVGLTASLGTLITFNLTNDVKVDAGPVHVTVGSDSANLSIAQPLTNAGSEPLLLDGVAAFLDSKGVLVAKAPFAVQRLLPGERLDFAAEYPGRLAAGSYRVLCSFRYEGKDLTHSTTFSVP